MTGGQTLRSSPAGSLRRGAASGLGATAVMTAVLLAARRLGLVDPTAPEAVVAGALRKVDLDEELRPPGRTVLVSVAHLGYGAALGAMFAMCARRLGGASVLCGSAFGLGVWILNYLGWLPAVGILPPPSRQGAGRHVENVAGHVVYGATLGAMTSSWDSGEPAHRPG